MLHLAGPIVVAIAAFIAAIKFEWHKPARDEPAVKAHNDSERREKESRSLQRANELMKSINEALQADKNNNEFSIVVEEFEKWGETANEHAVNVDNFISFVVNGNNEAVRVVTEVTNPDFTDFDDITLPTNIVYDWADLDADTLRTIVTGAHEAFIEAEDATQSKVV